ncbi:MAG: hypothetical protein K8F25_15850, partial [Fimbriimonadaceae bacterium]|nr:hypothetical protein [Alphaproteobacteria bacterium]
PIELLIDQTARRIPGFQTLVNTPFWGQFKRVAGRIILQGMAEGGQEGGQRVASNLISQFMSNPNQTWDEGAAHDALIGTIVGTGMQATQEAGSAVMPQAAPEAAPAVQAPPPPPPGPAPRVEPNLFSGPPKGPDDGGGGGGPDTSSSVLVQSGYTAEDIADMNPTERAAAVRAVAGEQALMPAKLPRPPIAPPESVPEVGTAPMAPRSLATQNTPNPFDQFDEAPQPAPRSEAVATGKRRVGSFEIAGDDVSPQEMFGIGSRKEERYDQEGEDAHSDVGVNMDEKGNIVDDEGNIVEGGRIEDAPSDWGGTSKASSPPPRPPVRAPIMRRDMEDDSAVTSSGRDVPVKYAVVEASDLVASQLDDGGANPQYPAELQPRDRERAVSQQQVQDIATRLDPRLLDKSPKASDGPPIISDDGTVESGNGRVLAIRRAYRQGGDAAKRYRDHLTAQGYPVGDVREPVLVRVRQGELDPESRQAFTREANERDTLGMSATERAMADATALPDNVLEMYRGGDVEAAGNREFVRAFIRDVVGKNDQANLIAGDGTLSQEAIRRVEAALLGKAYGDADLVASLVESPDSNIKAIGGALMDVAPAWAQMRAEAKAGTIDKDADQTERLLEAVRLVQRARREDQPLALLVGQNDIFSGTTLHPTAEFFLSLMFHDTQRWKQPMGREKLAAALQFYVEEERKTSSGVDLLGETAAKPNDILAFAKRKQENGSQATSTDQAKLDLAQRPRADNGKDTGNASERGAAQAAPRVEAAPGPEVAGDGRPEPKIEPPKAAEPTPEPTSQTEPLKETKPTARLPENKITDFGEKIEGARKDAVRDIVQSLTDDVDIASEPLSKTFPQPDYEKLSEAGVDRKALALVAVMRDVIPMKPKKAYKLKSWVESVKQLRDFSSDLLEGILTADAIIKKMRESRLTKIADTAEIISDIAPENLAFAAKFRVATHSYINLNGKHYPGGQRRYLLEDENGRQT